MPELWSQYLSDDAFDRAVRDAVMDGPPGETLLIGALPRLTGDRRTAVLAVLGDAQGTTGVAVLRAVLTESELDVDGRCAALLALAKRPVRTLPPNRRRI